MPIWNSAFLVKLILSFFIGGAYISLASWIAERFGSRIGGLLAGLPSTLLISVAFLAWTQSPQAAVSSLPIVPAAIAACSLFVAAFIGFYKFGRGLSIVLGLGAWFLATLPLAFLRLHNILISILLAALFFSIAILSLRKYPDRKLPEFHFTSTEMFLRMIFSGSFVALSVLLGKILGPLWGGMFASFPAAFSSSILILERKHGIDFTASVAKAMPLGSIGNVLFAFLLFKSAPAVGMIGGILIAYATALLFALFFLYVPSLRARH